MRNILNLFRAPEAKASRAARLVAIESGGRARWTPRDYAALAREGYLANAIVHRAVKLVAESAASVTYLAYEGDAAREPHPPTSLLARPNPRQERAAFLEALCAHLLLASNAYIEAVTLGGSVRELHALRPDRMRVVPGPDGWPEAYEYAVAGRTLRFEQGSPLPPILHLAQFPLLLEGGLDWKAMSLTPKDMDFLEAKHTAAREIALAFGVPPMLLGIPGDNTFANYQEANRVFWRGTVLPLAARIGASLSQWLQPAFGEVRLAVDTDELPALAADQAAKWAQVTKAPFLTLNEKRAMTGFGPVEGGDRL